MKMRDFEEIDIKRVIAEKIELLNIIQDQKYSDTIKQILSIILNCYRANGKILIAGNGGSAADAQHFAAELVGRFMKERLPLPAMSLCVDPSVVTSIGNDYGFENIFSRQVRAFGCKDDCFVGISTSGNSSDIIKAVDEAHDKGMTVIGLLGRDGGELVSMCDVSFVVPSDSTSRIQEIHTMLIHILCDAIEQSMFGSAQI